MIWRIRLAFVVLCACVYLCTTPGRIMFPDDEIVFQTTESLWNDGDLSIEGMPQRTGEPPGRRPGTFGWATGRDGARYGFFGRALSVVALPMYAVGTRLATAAPAAWRHAIRSDHYMYHRRSQAADWPRLIVSLTNSFVTAGSAWALAAWLRVLGFTMPVAVATALMYAFGSVAWPYSRTFLSEPLSALVLLGSALAIARFHRDRSDRRAARSLWIAGALAGLSVHTHVLNVVALPCLLGYALWPLARHRELRAHRPAWLGAVALGLVGLVALAVAQYLQFGDPFETGRFGHYSSFAPPWESLPAMIVAPGRSLWLYSPAAIIALLGWAALFRRRPAVAWFCLAMIAARMAFVAVRSDWWGGWAIGPRYLVPIVPFAVLPIVMVIERIPRMSSKGLAAIVVGATLAVVIEAHLAAHSIWEWMHTIAQRASRLDSAYIPASHWDPRATPLLGFFDIDVDMLSVGSFRLLRHGHYGMALVFCVVVILGIVAATILGRETSRTSR